MGQYPPGQSFTVKENGIGLTSTQTALPLVIGVTSGGTAATLYQYSNAQALKDAHGYGPAVELAAPIADRGGVLLLKTAASTAGSSSAVTPHRVGTSTGTITLSGAPYNHHYARVVITKTGTLGAGKFKYSLDASPLLTSDQYTYSEEYTIPSGGTFTIPHTNVVATFVAGAGPTYFEAADYHTWEDTAPHYTTTDLGTAITALLAQIGTRQIRKVFFSGKNATASGAATMAAAIATHMATLATNFYFARAMMDGGKDTAANWLTSFASFSDSRVDVVFGDHAIATLNTFAGWGTPHLPSLNAVAERAAIAQLSENLGRKASGPLRGVVAISDDEGLSQQFSESDKVTTLRSFRGEAGFYVTNGFLKSPAGSDFKYWDWGITIDEGCTVVHTAQQRWLLAKLRSLTDGTGNMDDRDAARVNKMVRAALKVALLDPDNIEGFKGHVSGISYSVDETNDFLATQQIQSGFGAVPLSPVEGFTTQVGFTRSV